MSAPPPPTQRIPKASSSSAEPSGERRRQQLVRAAAHVIEYEGIDALRMPRVAELVGCARTLVYRYFPTREDLLMAVVSEYYAAFEKAAAQYNRHRPPDPIARREEPLEASLPMIDVSFDIITELGLAGLLLRTSPHTSEAVREHIANESRNFSKRWIEPLRAAGISDLDVALVSQAAVAVLVELVQRWHRGEVTRDDAVRMCRFYCLTLLRGLAAPSTR